jgi:hypothetical protein
MTHAPADDSRAALRRMVYWILIVLGTGLMLGRIFAVDSVDMEGLERYRIEQIRGELEAKRARLQQQGAAENRIRRELARTEAELRRRAELRRPFLSANDRSRWATLRALVEPEMRVPGAPYAIDKVLDEPGWDTIDLVKHDGHLYSSKPTLLPTLLAAEYWVIHKLTGRTLGEEPYAIGRFMLVTVNVLPLVLYFWLLARLAERRGTSDWGRIFTLAAATVGTFLTTFAVVLNNHVLAAVTTLVCLDCLVRILIDGDRRLRWFALAGLAAALTATNELPAMAFFAAVLVGLMWKAPKQTVLAFAPAALAVAAASLATNWIAHGTLSPPYAHRSKTDPADNWYEFTYERNGKLYHSYWKNPVGVDRGEPSQPKYVFHALVGHHGVFSLTPVWILSFVGMGLWLARPPDPRLRELALLVAGVTLVCLVFYLFVLGERDRNYGGMSSGFRWMFWFAPMWLVTMLPALDRMAGRKWLRGLALAMLLVSVMSASYPTWNPWTHPWLWDLLRYMGRL